MDLPAELRLHIYDHLVPNKSFVQLYRRHPSSYLLSGRLPIYLDIMRTSRAIYAETTKHFSGKPTLLMDVARPLAHSIKYIPRRLPHREQEYAERVSHMSHEVKRHFTRLEFKVTPVQTLYYDQKVPNCGLLPQICAALPNLSEVVISFNHMRRLSMDARYLDSQRATIEWLRTQLPEGLRIAWDLTWFGEQDQDAARYKEMIMSAQLMRDLVERDGTLHLAQSADTTQEDRERWAGIRHTVLEAIRLL